MANKSVYYKTSEGVRLKPTTRIFKASEKAQADAYAHDIRTYVGVGFGYDKDYKQAEVIYYVPR